MLKHLGVCRAAGGEQPPKSEGERERFAHARAALARLSAKKYSGLTNAKCYRSVRY